MNYKRKRPRTSSTSIATPQFPRGSPRWWDVVFHTRPMRRRISALLSAVRHGADPDGIAWPVSSRKPHNYYW